MSATIHRLCDYERADPLPLSAGDVCRVKVHPAVVRRVFRDIGGGMRATLAPIPGGGWLIEAIEDVVLSGSASTFIVVDDGGHDAI